MTMQKAVELDPSKVAEITQRRADALTHSRRQVQDSGVSETVILARNSLDGLPEQALVAVEKYRLLCMRVMQVATSLKSQIFLVTSASGREGKTLTALNLAYGLSRVPGKRVLLAELDLRRPTMRNMLGLQQRKELHFLEVDGDWHELLWQLRPNLDALLAMNSSLRGDVLLQGERMHTFLAEARREYDFIVIDSAPLLATADTHALVPVVDQALLVVRAEQTNMVQAQKAIAILGNKTLGCVLNDVKRVEEESYDAYTTEVAGTQE